ncbi:MAG: GNAT family N-acetyltransferase [Alsobacter sp.]
MTAHPASVAGLEERGCNAWPALRTALVGGWLARSAEGFSKRANSACALPGAAPLPAVLSTLQDVYARQGLPCILRLTPLAPRGTAALLDAEGWASVDETSVQVAHLGSRAAGAGRPAGLALSAAADAGWAAGFGRANGRPDMNEAVLLRMLAALPAPAAFARLVEGGEEVCYGMAVVERGMVGLFDIATPAAHRGRGHARRLVAGLMAWGREQGAHDAYLQVTTGNGPALALYASLGFVETYRYVYRLSR